MSKLSTLLKITTTPTYKANVANDSARFVSGRPLLSVFSFMFPGFRFEKKKPLYQCVSPVSVLILYDLEWFSVKCCSYSFHYRSYSLSLSGVCKLLDDQKKKNINRCV